MCRYLCKYVCMYVIPRTLIRHLSLMSYVLNFKKIQKAIRNVQSNVTKTNRMQFINYSNESN